MKPPKKKRNKIIELGSGPSLVRIYTIYRSDGYPQHTVTWKEGGRRKTRVFANLDEARLIARQQVVRLTNVVEGAGEVTLRDVEVFQHCEAKAKEQGVTLSAAVDEWLAARKILNKADLIEAVRFFKANRRDFLPVKSVSEVADEFVRSREAAGMSRPYVKTAEQTTKKFVEAFPVPIGEITVQQIDKYLGGLKGVVATTRNSRRRIIVTMFSFARKQGYLHRDRQTAAQLAPTHRSGRVWFAGSRRLATRTRASAHHEALVDEAQKKVRDILDSCGLDGEELKTQVDNFIDSKVSVALVDKPATE